MEKIRLQFGTRNFKCWRQSINGANKNTIKKVKVKESIGILATKKLAHNQKQFLLNAGFKVIDEDFIHIQPIAFEVKNTNDILIFTSQNTVLNVLTYKDEFIHKPTICVGEKTKNILLENGFSVVCFQSEAEELIRSIENEYMNKSFTFFCGTSKLNTIPDFLKEKSLKHEIIEVYETTETPVKIASKMDGILFFSPSGVSSYIKEHKITNEICFCIGTTTATAIKPFADNIIIANQPSVENVIIKCIHYFKSTKND
jgi:uroporphyrinogen-III synthase